MPLSASDNIGLSGQVEQGKEVPRSIAIAASAALGVIASGCSGKAASRSPEDGPRRVQVVKAEKGLLRPGSFARAVILTESGGDSVVVPSSSLVLFAGIEKVVTVKDGKALERPVTTGRRAGDVVEIVSGLEDGEAVVVKPGNLATGMPVEIVAASVPAS